MEQREALEELRAIRAVMEQTRRAAGRGGWGRFMVLWGTVWLLGFLGTQFILVTQFVDHHWINWLWGTLNLVGAAGSIWMGIRLERRTRSPLGRRIFLFWLASVAFTLLIWRLFGSRIGIQYLGVFIVLVVALAFVQFGIFFSTAVACVGSLIAALGLVGFLLLPAYFNLIMSLLGGGLMIGMGLWIIRRWE